MDELIELRKKILELEKKQLLFNETENSGKIGGWEFDPVTLKQNWTDEVFRILEIDLEHEAPEVPKGLDFIDPGYRPMAERAIQKAMEFGEPYNQEWIVTTSRGKKKWVNAVCNPKVKNGKVVAVSGSFQDITSKKILEEELKKSEERLRIVLDNSPFPVAVVDEKGNNILFWSKSAIQLFGHDPKTSEEWYELAYPNPEYRQDVIERWKPFLEIAQNSTQAINTGEYEIQCKNGAVKICELYAQFIPGSLIVTLNDITERKNAETQLNAQNQQLIANEQQLKASNQQLQASEQQLRAANQQLSASEQQLLAANQQLRANEQQLKAANQQLIAREKELKDANNNFKAAKETAEENEAFLIAAMENSQAGIAIAEVPSGKLSYVNKAALLIRDKDYDEVVKDIDVEKYVESWQILHLDGTPYKTDEVPLARAVLYGESSSNEFIVRRDNNEDRYVWANAAPILNEKGKQIAAIVVFLDITEKKLTEISLNKEHEELVKVQEIAQVGNWYLDIVTNEVVWSKELYKMYGFDPTKPLPPFTEHMKLFTPESWEILSSSLAETREKGIPYELELRTVKEDKSNGWMWVRGEALYDENKKIVGIWGAAQDITERKKVEEELKKHRDHLDELVKERTAELEGKNKMLDDQMRVFVGRELRIKKLENDIRMMDKDID